MENGKNGKKNKGKVKKSSPWTKRSGDGALRSVLRRCFLSPKLDAFKDKLFL